MGWVWGVRFFAFLGDAGFSAVVGVFVLFEAAVRGPLVFLRSTALRLAFGKSTAAQSYPGPNLVEGANSYLAALFPAPPKFKVKAARRCLALCNL